MYITAVNNKYNFPAVAALVEAAQPGRVVEEGEMEGLKFKHQRIDSGGGRGCGTKGKKKTFPRRRRL